MSTDLPLQFGKYSAVQRLGEGGFGEVYQAIDSALNRPVALKVPHRELLRDPSFVAQFRQEARLAAQLDHPNIVRIYAIDEIEGTPYLEMELVEGQTLAELIKSKGKLTPEEALPIIEQVCAALQEAHSKGIIHRDIKPQNILIRRSDGRVLVTDFGLAKATETSFQASLSSSNVVVGTFRYMPPEQANRKLGEIGPASDLYSLGVVLYEMLTGRVPFDSDSVGQLIYEHTSEPPEPPSNINIALSRSVESVVLKALQKRPVERFSSATDMAQALQAAVKQNKIVPIAFPEKQPVAPVATPATPKPRRGVLAVTMLAAVGLMAALVIVAIQVSGNDKMPSDGATGLVVTRTPSTASQVTVTTPVQPTLDATPMTEAVAAPVDVGTVTTNTADADQPNINATPSPAKETESTATPTAELSSTRGSAPSTLPPLIVRDADLRMSLSAQPPDIPEDLMQVAAPYVIVEYANLIQQQLLANLPSGLLELAAAVTVRPLVEQANTIQYIFTSAPPTTMLEKTESVPPHVDLEYANTGQIVDLTYPSGLLTATGQ